MIGDNDGLRLRRSFLKKPESFFLMIYKLLMLNTHSPQPIATALRSLLADAAGECQPALSRVTGTHALLLDTFGDEPSPQVAGLGRWLSLRADENGGLNGPLRASVDALPFVDGGFCAVLIRHAAGCGLQPGRIAGEAARVLAPHGLLLVVELHPWSAWRPWLDERLRRRDAIPDVVSPQRWRRAFQDNGLAPGEARRCGAPWPRADGARGLPRWFQRGGGAYLIEARKHESAGIPQRLQNVRPRAVEQGSWAPHAHRSRV